MEYLGFENGILPPQATAPNGTMVPLNIHVRLISIVWSTRSRLWFSASGFAQPLRCMSSMITACSGWIKPGTNHERPRELDNVDSRRYFSTKERAVL